jgi:hypothetical protein
MLTPNRRDYIEALDEDAFAGANMGATEANGFPRQANNHEQAGGDDARSRTDPDDAERLTDIYGSEGWGFESLRARSIPADQGPSSQV